MKITKTQLKQIIKEELSNILEGNIQEEYCKQNPKAEGCREYFERLDTEDKARALGINQDIIDEFDDTEDLISIIDAVGELKASPEEVSKLEYGQLYRATKPYSSLT
tara:strand:- start:782 stop:1102 length:321 start_codon:yes stop_codon:yes gene_type:complete